MPPRRAAEGFRAFDPPASTEVFSSAAAALRSSWSLSSFASPEAALSTNRRPSSLPGDQLVSRLTEMPMTE
jgi:hypothetical protein